MCNTNDHPLFKNIAKIRTIILEKTGSEQEVITMLKRWAPLENLSTTKAYEWLRVKDSSKAWMPIIWRSYIPPKYSFILWLNLRGKLYTKSKWLGEHDKNCVFRKSARETTDHLFFRCTFVRAVWMKVKNWLGINREMNTLLSVIKRIKIDFKGAFVRSKAVILAFAATVYITWKTRNEALFQIKIPNVSLVFTSI